MRIFALRRVKTMKSKRELLVLAAHLLISFCSHQLSVVCRVVAGVDVRPQSQCTIHFVTFFEESNKMPLYSIPLNCILIVAGELSAIATHGQDRANRHSSAILAVECCTLL